MLERPIIGAARLGPARGGQRPQIGAGAGKRPVHALAAGHGVEFTGDRRQKIAPRVMGVLLFLPGALLQIGQALAHPKQTCGAPFGPAACQPLDERLGIVALGQQPPVAPDFGCLAAPPAFVQPVRGALNLDIQRDLRIATNVGS